MRDKNYFVLKVEELIRRLHSTLGFLWKFLMEFIDFKQFEIQEMSLIDPNHFFKCTIFFVTFTFASATYLI